MDIISVMQGVSPNYNILKLGPKHLLTLCSVKLSSLSFNSFPKANFDPREMGRIRCHGPSQTSLQQRLCVQIKLWWVAKENEDRPILHERVHFIWNPEAPQNHVYFCFRIIPKFKKNKRILCEMNMY